MNKYTKTLPFLFVFSMVSLYGSMTCTRLSANTSAQTGIQTDVVITRSAEATAKGAATRAGQCDTAAC
jgi:hypothetical protein